MTRIEFDDLWSQLTVNAYINGYNLQNLQMKLSDLKYRGTQALCFMINKFNKLEVRLFFIRDSLQYCIELGEVDRTYYSLSKASAITNSEYEIIIANSFLVFDRYEYYESSSYDCLTRVTLMAIQLISIMKYLIGWDYKLHNSINIPPRTDAEMSRMIKNFITIYDPD